jgi:hypothetical protein
MTTVLLFAEHELNRLEVAATLEALAELRLDGERPVDVTVLVPHQAHWPVALMDDVAAARGSAASPAFEDARRDGAVARREAGQVLRHVLSSLHVRGHAARGELVPVHEAVRDLVTEAAAREAAMVLLVSSPHRLAHLVHRDLEYRLRRAGVLRVVRVATARPTAAPSTSAPQIATHQA